MKTITSTTTITTMQRSKSFCSINEDSNTECQEEGRQMVLGSFWNCSFHACKSNSYLLLLNQQMHTQCIKLYRFYKSSDMFQGCSTIPRDLLYQVL
jgi:hypothetical protein